MNTQPIQSALASSLLTAQPTRAPAAGAGVDFTSSLEAALKAVSQQQHSAGQATRAFQAGDPAVGLEETMVAMSKAQISFQATVQVRNKLVQAYESMMNMPI